MLRRVTLLCCGVLAVAGSAWAVEEEEQGISVIGVGEVLTQPDTLEVRLPPMGTAEMSADALVKFRDAQRRAAEAFGKLGLTNLTVEQDGVGVGNLHPQQNPYGYQTEDAGAKAQTAVQGGLRLVLTSIDKTPKEEVTDIVSKMLDTARDVGCSPPPSIANGINYNNRQMNSSAVRFIVSDSREARQRAAKQAFEEAKLRAEQLAQIGQTKLGRVLSVTEARPMDQGDATSNKTLQMMAMMYGWQLGEAPDSKVSSDKLAEIPIRVVLKVRFALESATAKSP